LSAWQGATVWHSKTQLSNQRFVTLAKADFSPDETGFEMTVTVIANTRAGSAVWQNNKKPAPSLPFKPKMPGIPRQMAF